VDRGWGGRGDWWKWSVEVQCLDVGVETEAVRIEERVREVEEEKETTRETVRDGRVEDLGVAVGYIGGV